MAHVHIFKTVETSYHDHPDADTGHCRDWLLKIRVHCILTEMEEQMVPRTGILAVVDQLPLKYVLTVQLIIISSFNNLGLRPQISVLNCRPTAF